MVNNRVLSAPSFTVISSTEAAIWRNQETMEAVMSLSSLDQLFCWGGWAKWIALADQWDHWAPATHPVVDREICFSHVSVTCVLRNDSSVGLTSDFLRRRMHNAIVRFFQPASSSAPPTPCPSTPFKMVLESSHQDLPL